MKSPIKFRVSHLLVLTAISACVLVPLATPNRAFVQVERSGEFRVAHPGSLVVTEYFGDSEPFECESGVWTVDARWVWSKTSKQRWCQEIVATHESANTGRITWKTEEYWAMTAGSTGGLFDAKYFNKTASFPKAVDWFGQKATSWK